MYWNGLPLVIFGVGGISRESLYIIEEINNFNKVDVFNFVGFVGNDKSIVGEEVFKGYKIICTDNNFAEFAKKYSILGAVIPIGNPKIKMEIYNKIKNIENIVFPNIIHPDVTFDRTTIRFGLGNVITSGCRLTNNIYIGNFNLINLNSTVGHDTKLGEFNVINPLVSISGNVNIENCCLIGTGANILQQLNIRDNATIGAGAVVVKDVLMDETVIGVPAKPIKRGEDVSRSGKDG